MLFLVSGSQKRGRVAGSCKGVPKMISRMHQPLNWLLTGEIIENIWKNVLNLWQNDFGGGNLKTLRNSVLGKDSTSSSAGQRPTRPEPTIRLKQVCYLENNLQCLVFVTLGLLMRSDIVTFGGFIVSFGCFRTRMPYPTTSIEWHRLRLKGK